jgi:hypothetical protein
MLLALSLLLLSNYVKAWQGGDLYELQLNFSGNFEIPRRGHFPSVIEEIQTEFSLLQQGSEAKELASERDAVML